ncbi:GSCOCG00007880001-RA-CDS, partial [Cotesia congregata]
AWHWELTLSDDKIPPYKDLLKFLEKRAVCRDNVRNDTNSNHNSKLNHHRPQTQAFYSNNNAKQHLSNHQHETLVNCPVCDEKHRLYTCDKFRELTVEERRKVVLNAQLCFNCFGNNHTVKLCRSKGTCRKCLKRHNTLLHIENTDNSSVSPKSESNNNNNNNNDSHI